MSLTMNMESVSSWFGSIGKQITNLTYIPPEDEDPKEAEKTATDKDESPDNKENKEPIVQQPENKENEKAEDTKKDDKEKEEALEEGTGVDPVAELSEKAKEWGGTLLSFANKATKTVATTAIQLKTTIEENTILGEFEAEQKKFIEEKEAKKMASVTALAVVPPWVGYNEEPIMKKQILSLSLDSRNFLRDPPAGIQFTFDYETMNPVAIATLEEDPNLRKMRFQLVPKQVPEERFWRNYFYRVSLIKQSAQVSSMARGDHPEPEATPTTSDHQSAAEGGAKASESHESDEAKKTAVRLPSSPTDGNEFLSDTAQTEATEEEIAKVREQLGIAQGIIHKSPHLFEKQGRGN